MRSFLVAALLVSVASEQSRNCSICGDGYEVGSPYVRTSLGCPDPVQESSATSCTCLQRPLDCGTSRIDFRVLCGFLSDFQGMSLSGKHFAEHRASNVFSQSWTKPAGFTYSWTKRQNLKLGSHSLNSSIFGTKRWSRKMQNQRKGSSKVYLALEIPEPMVILVAIILG